MDLTTKISNYFISKADRKTILNAYYSKSKGRPIDWKRQTQNMSAKKIEDWKMSLMSATDPDNPRRGDLMRFYNNLLTDLHLSACIENRVLPVQCAPFKLVDKDNNPNSEAKKLLERPWWLDLTRLITNHTFEGTKLIEMFEVNEKGELKEVTEIPQSNFIPTKGIVIKEEYDDNGVSYKEGKYKNYYVQIGSDWNLGVLNRVAVIVIAKKMGLGAWLSYIEKYGVPAIFAITDRIDDNRRDELFEMLENFRMNHFAVLQGGEKIETSDSAKVDAHNTFKSIIDDVANKELSKFLNGGTGTTDEKAFVGSAEVHERQLLMRIMVDKLLFKYYFNEEIKPRLVALSPVYAPLENLTFEWDETETLTLKEILEAIKGLSAYYNFTIDKLVKLTGLPFESVKSALKTTEPKTEKKKTEPSAMGLQYAPFAVANTHIYAATWDAAIERLANQIYNGEVKPADLDRDLVLKNYAAFNKAAEAGYGAGYYEKPIGQTMRNNILRYSGAKTYNLMQRLETLKADSKDKADFTTKAKQLVQMHNDTWLDTEKQFVSRSAEVVREWEQFQEDKDLYPNLVFRTMLDDAVRDEHQKLEGITKPVDDPFWLIHTPPLGHKCRCTVEQTLSPVTPDKDTPKIKVAKEFAHNPGMKGEIFTPKNTYEQSIQQKHFNRTRENTELHKQFIPYSRTIKTKTATVYVNDFADLADLEENIQAAKRIAEATQKDIYVRHHIDGGVVQNHKNPELGLGTKNKFGDLKTYDGDTLLYNFTQNAVKSANKQRAEFIVLEVSKATDYKLLKRALKGSLNNRNRNIKKVFVLSENAVFSLTRTQIMKNNFDKL